MTETRPHTAVEATGPRSRCLQVWLLLETLFEALLSVSGAAARLGVKMGHLIPSFVPTRLGTSSRCEHTGHAALECTPMTSCSRGHVCKGLISKEGQVHRAAFRCPEEGLSPKTGSPCLVPNVMFLQQIWSSPSTCELDLVWKEGSVRTKRHTLVTVALCGDSLVWAASPCVGGETQMTPWASAL